MRKALGEKTGTTQSAIQGEVQTMIPGRVLFYGQLPLYGVYIFTSKRGG